MSIYGIDVSHWDGNIDWSRIKQDGRVKFVIMKSSEGTSWVDDKFAANKAGCQFIGMPYGAYHFFRSNQDPRAQANHFWNTVNDASIKFLALDVETNDGSWNGLSIADAVKVCLDRLQQLSGEIPWIYTGPYFWKDVVKSPAWSVNYWLWIANYGVQYPMIPSPWINYKIWQFSSKGSVNGIQTAVDENWFNGDVQEMFDCFNNGNEVPEIPQQTGIKKAMVNVASLTIRSKPVVDPSTVLGYTTYGKVWELEDTVKDASGNIWNKVGTSAYIAGWLCKTI